MANKIVLQQNDNGIKILFSITKDGNISDISDAKVRVKLKNATSGTEYWKDAKIMDAENGQAQCVFFKKDLAESGSFSTEVETTYPNGLRISDKNPFTVVISEESFDITQDIIEDFPDYKDENLE